MTANASAVRGFAALVMDEVQRARADKAPLRIVGGGTWLDAGRPVRSDRALELRSLVPPAVVHYEPGDLTLTVSSTMTLAEIDRLVRAEGQWLALDPAGSASGTIGATVATASAGPLASAFGTPREQVLGVEVVTGRGEVIRAGGRVVKNVAGFDLTRLMTGAWGSLGVITEVTLRVRSAGLEPGSVEHLRRITAARSGYREPVMTHPALSSVLKRTFDPAHVLNPGIMGEVVGSMQNAQHLEQA